MNTKLAIRLIIGLFVIAVLVLGFQWWRSIRSDPDFGHANTVDMIGALEDTADGSQAVIFKADGTKIPSPDYKEGSVDRDFVWQPDGERAFFLSDRAKGIHIFRWNPEANSLQQRSTDGGSKGTMIYGPVGNPPVEQSALISAGGRVLRYDPKVPATYQIIPPKLKERASGEEGGSGGSFETFYERIGTSFKKAMWGKDRKWIIAVMRRDLGEVLILQNMTPLKDLNTGEEKLLPPNVMTAGQRVDFDVAADGRVVVTTTGFQFPEPDKAPKEYIKNGKLVPPYRNAVTFFDPDNLGKVGMKAVAVLPDEIGAMQPRLSPDGSKVLLAIGKPDADGNIVSAGLVAMPFSEGGGAQGAPILKGQATDASWSADGNKIVYIKHEDSGKRSVFVIRADGSDDKKISDGSTSYTQPVFSPQLPKSQ